MNPPRFHVLAKPSGSACNLDCAYCFYLDKAALYPDSNHRMSPATLETYVRQLLEGHESDLVTVAWQGGEPTLMGVDFYRRAVALVARYKRPEQRVDYTFQTNGVLIDDEWAAFLKEHNFLVGVSIDGPQELHDTYRRNKGGQGTFREVLRGWECLQNHGVDTNVLCTVNAANQAAGRRVYSYFRDVLGAQFMQFIPIVERGPDGRVSERSVAPPLHGRFLIEIYEDWIRRDVGKVFVQLFDATLNAFFGQYTLCIHAPTCGLAPALEHNGDLYACDHFVNPVHLLGNVHETAMIDMVASSQQRAFGVAKATGLTRQCLECEVRALCNGGCPKDRFSVSRHGEAGHNYLCTGLFHFFTHVRPSMAAMGQYLRYGGHADAIMARVAAEDAKRGRNEPCTCGSGRKFKVCHGRSGP